MAPFWQPAEQFDPVTGEAYRHVYDRRDEVRARMCGLTMGQYIREMEDDDVRW